MRNPSRSASPIVWFLARAACVAGVWLCGLAVVAQAETTKVFDQEALLRYIENRDAWAGSVACTPHAPYLDLLLLGTKWYTAFGPNLTGCNCDVDRDGLSSCFEIALGTDPNNPDTDGDCLGDGLEVMLGTNPLAPDSDGNGTRDNLEDSDHNGTADGMDDYDKDGLTNCEEVTVYHTNPVEADTDADRLKDGEEITRQTNPLVADTDHDGFIDGEEVEFSSDPLDKNSLPIDPNAVIGDVVATFFSVENLTDPSLTAQPLESMSPMFSVENLTDPSLTSQPLESVSAVFSVENLTDPSLTSQPLEAMSFVISVYNQSDPTQDLYGLAFRAPFSVRNTAGQKAARNQTFGQGEASQ